MDPEVQQAIALEDAIEELELFAGEYAAAVLTLADSYSADSLGHLTARMKLLRAVKACLQREHEAVIRLERERDELLLDRHQPGRVSPCGHYRVFAIPCVDEDGVEHPYCMQCNRDELQAALSGEHEARKQAEEELESNRACNLYTWKQQCEQAIRERDEARAQFRAATAESW